MKSFLKYSLYGIFFSGILLFLTFLLNFAPLDPENNNVFSNGFITGLTLLGWGANRIRSNQIWRASRTDIIYGINNSKYETKPGEHERMTDSQLPSALGLFLAAAINFTLSFFL